MISVSSLWSSIKLSCFVLSIKILVSFFLFLFFLNYMYVCMYVCDSFKSLFPGSFSYSALDVGLIS